jgi:hypothetical protein
MPLVLEVILVEVIIQEIFKAQRVIHAICEGYIEDKVS